MLIPEDFAQVNWIFGGSAAPTGAEVTLGINVDLWEGTVPALAEAIFGMWVDTVLPLQCTTLQLQTCRVKMGPNDTGQMAEFSAPVAGSSAAEALSPQVAVLVSKQTVIGGRKGRGRLFVPGTPEADVNSSGILSTNAIGFLQDAFDELHAALNTNDTGPRLLHGVFPSQPSPYFIENFAVQPKVATQRKRLRR